MTSCQVLMPTVCHIAHRLLLLAMLPIQVNARPSNLASPSSGSIGMLRDMVPNTLPSFGATE